MHVYRWPGNVREVEFLIERVTLRYPESDVISAAMLAESRHS